MHKIVNKIIVYLLILIFLVVSVYAIIIYPNLIEKYSITILTALLVVITAYYAWATKGMVREMQTARRYQFIPSLKIRPTRLYISDSFDIEITNIGLGPAKNIKGKIKLEPLGEEIDIIYPILYPKERFALHNPFSKAKSYSEAKQFKEVKLDVTFQDVTNNYHKGLDVFNLSDLEKIRNDAYESNTISGRLERIETRLGNIDSSIRNLKR